METHSRRKIDMLLDQPLMGRVTRDLDRLGITGYTAFQSIGGRGGSGAWRPGDVSNAEAKVLITVVTREDLAQQLIDHFAPLLNDYGMVLYASTVEVIRPEKY